MFAVKLIKIDLDIDVWIKEGVAKQKVSPHSLYCLEDDALAALSPAKNLNLYVDILIVLIIRNSRLNLRNLRIAKTADAFYRKVVPVVAEHTVTAKERIIITIIRSTSSPRSQLVEVLYAGDVVCLTVQICSNT